jgi:chemotaxis protein CheD
MSESIMVGMGEIKIARGSDQVLTALGLGSCIGVCAYDRSAKVAGMAHVVLPESPINSGELPGKFAATAIPALIEEMKKHGATPRNIRIALAGGAQLFAFTGKVTHLDIGNRNAIAVNKAIEKHNLTIQAHDLGGTVGRTVQLHAGDGRVSVRTIGQGEKNLTVLG